MATAAVGGGAKVVVKETVADCLMTFIWVFCVSTLGPLTYLISTTISSPHVPALLITTSLLFLLLLLCSAVSSLLGGASFNPTSTVAFYSAGINPNTDLVSMAFRFPAQAAGAVGGALAILEFTPKQYSGMLRGPSLKVDVHNGAAAEGILMFVLSFMVLLIVTRGPRNPIVKTGLLAMATVTLVVNGSGYTGPSMNPANAFAWAYINNRHNTWEQFYVYWISPFIGAILAAWVFRLFFPPAIKMKKA